MIQEISIDGRKIGPAYPPYIVAELSANHGNSLEKALRTIEIAKACGADAVKIQTYTADTMTINFDGPDFQINGGLWNGRVLYELYEEAHTPWQWHEAIFAKARELGITCFSTPFDLTAVEFLEKFDPPAFKIASFELIDLELISRVARIGKPVIISTGMGSSSEISEAVDVFQSSGGRELIILHCISGYPTPPCQSNLRRIPGLADQFTCPVGLSDHTLGIDVSIASIALGASFIEKHFTLSRSDGGPDSEFSIEPAELERLCCSARSVFDSLGDGRDVRSQVEKENMIFRRSIYVVKDIDKGGVFSHENLRVIRPGFGLPPKELSKVIGRRANQPIARGTRLSWLLVD